MRPSQTLLRRVRPETYRPTPTDLISFFQSPRSKSYTLHPSITKLQFHVPHNPSSGPDSFQAPRSLPEPHRLSDHKVRARVSSAARQHVELLRQKVENLSWQGMVEAKERLEVVREELKVKEAELKELERKEELEREDRRVKGEREYDEGMHDLQLMAYENPSVEIEFVHPEGQEVAFAGAAESEEGEGKEELRPALAQDIRDKKQSKLSIYLKSSPTTPISISIPPSPSLVTSILTSPSQSSNSSPDYAALFAQAQETFEKEELPKMKERLAAAEVGWTLSQQEKRQRREQEARETARRTGGQEGEFVSA